MEVDVPVSIGLQRSKKQTTNCEKEKVLLLILMNFTGEKICNTKYVMAEQFSKGTVGTLYNVKDNKKLLVKVMPINRRDNRSSIMREINFMTKAAAKAVTPKIYNAKFCEYNGKKYVFLVIEKYGEGTLEDLFSAFNNMNFRRQKNNSILQDVGEKITNLLDNLYSIGIIHGDLHAQNILYRLTKSGKIYLKIIDFGYSKIINNNENYNREDKCILSLNGSKKLEINKQRTKYLNFSSGFL